MKLKILLCSLLAISLCGNLYSAVMVNRILGSINNRKAEINILSDRLNTVEYKLDAQPKATVKYISYPTQQPKNYDYEIDRLKRDVQYAKDEAIYGSHRAADVASQQQALQKQHDDYVKEQEHKKFMKNVLDIDVDRLYLGK